MVVSCSTIDGAEDAGASCLAQRTGFVLAGSVHVKSKISIAPNIVCRHGGGKLGVDQT
jgi:hypothetical protein